MDVNLGRIFGYGFAGIMIALMGTVAIGGIVDGPNSGAICAPGYTGPAPTAHYALEETAADIPPPGTNLLVNGGFEDYPVSPGAPTGWSIAGAGNAAQFTRETSIVREGVNALKITRDGSASTPFIHQSFTDLTIGDAYQFRAYGFRPEAPTGTVRIVVEDTTAPPYTIVSQIQATQNAYTGVASGFIPTEAAHTYRVLLQTSGTTGSPAYFDDAELIKSLRVNDAINGAFGSLGSHDPEAMVGVAGAIGNAMRFDGMGESVVINGKLHDGIRPTATGLSFGAWVNPSAYNTQTSPRIFDKSQYYLAVDADTPFQTVENAAHAVFGGLTPSFIYSPNPLPLNSWSLVVATWNPTTATTNLYVNGEKVAETSVSGTVAVNNNPLVIGNDQIAELYWNGVIDEVKIWNNIALTDAQVKGLYNDVIPDCPSLWNQATIKLWRQIPLFIAGFVLLGLSYGLIKPNRNGGA